MVTQYDYITNINHQCNISHIQTMLLFCILSCQCMCGQFRILQLLLCYVHALGIPEESGMYKCIHPDKHIKLESMSIWCNRVCVCVRARACVCVCVCATQYAIYRKCKVADFNPCITQLVFTNFTIVCSVYTRPYILNLKEIGLVVCETHAPENHPILFTFSSPSHHFKIIP